MKNKKYGIGGRRRGNHKGTLEKQGNTYIARWYITGDDGKRRRISKSTGSGDIVEARKFLDQMTRELNLDRQEEILKSIAKVKLGIANDRKTIEDEKSQAPAMLLEDAFEAYLTSPDRRDASERTLCGYEAQFDALLKWIKKHFPEVKEMRSLTKLHADAFVRELGKDHSPNTYNKYLTFFKCLWNTLEEDARLVSNPWSKMKKRVQMTHSRRELTIDELNRLTSIATGEMRTLLAIGIYTGLRLGDCCTIKWSNIDIARSIIMVVPRKTQRHNNGKPVIIPIHPVLLRVLLETPENERKGQVLPGICDAYMAEPSNVTGKIRKLFMAAGISPSTDLHDGTRVRSEASFHSLRHTFVSLCSNANVPLVSIQAIVGHANPSMTMHYAHANQTVLTNAIAQIPEVIKTRES